jgi:hypothetical protein
VRWHPEAAHEFDGPRPDQKWLKSLAELTKVVLSEFEVCGEPELAYSHATLRALDCICAGITPKTEREARHLLEVLGRLHEFLRDDPVDEGDRDVAFALSARIIAAIIDYYSDSGTSESEGVDVSESKESLGLFWTAYSNLRRSGPAPLRHI